MDMSSKAQIVSTGHQLFSKQISAELFMDVNLARHSAETERDTVIRSLRVQLALSAANRLSARP